VGVDLVCWDFGDTLVDERFMRLAPDGVSDWGRVYDEVLAERPRWVAELDLGRASLNDLIEPLAERLGLTRAAVAAHLRAVWHRIEWFDDARAAVERLDGVVDQAVVTVNPHEFAGIASACGLDRLIPTLVTSAELATTSKVALAERARQLLGLHPGLTTTILVDNRVDNVAEFAGAGGRTIHYRPGTNCLAPLDELVSP
jgi:FMN phosphatase YigB (HAD superfamily)